MRKYAIVLYLDLIFFIILMVTAIVYMSSTPTVRTLPDAEVPLSSARDNYNEKGLAEDLKKMESGHYMLDNMIPLEESSTFFYEFYARYPEITLNYSPRFHRLGYCKDTNMCAGFDMQLISEGGGEQKYEDIRAATDGLIEDLEDDSNSKKINKVKEWMSQRCSYSKSPQNMWDSCLYGCLVHGSATCLGYSEGFLYLMDRLDVPCHIVCNEYHAWNIVYDGEDWVKVDLTQS